MDNMDAGTLRVLKQGKISLFHIWSCYHLRTCITVDLGFQKITALLPSCSHPSTVLRSRESSDTVPNCLASLEIEFRRLLAAVITSSNCGMILISVISCSWNRTAKRHWINNKAMNKKNVIYLKSTKTWHSDLFLKTNQLRFSCWVSLNELPDLLLSESLQRNTSRTSFTASFLLQPVPANVTGFFHLRTNQRLIRVFIQKYDVPQIFKIKTLTVSHHECSEVQNALPLAAELSQRLLTVSCMLVELTASVPDVITSCCLHHTSQLHLQRWPVDESRPHKTLLELLVFWLAVPVDIQRHGFIVELI